MNELVWEGLLEIVREGQPSLKAAARLWRRDDFFGSDWGGQLELPVVFRRLLPAEEYLVRLPSGLEGRARIASGPSTTTMTFPTLTGIGNPPFGGSTGASDPEASVVPTANGEDIEDVEDVGQADDAVTEAAGAAVESPAASRSAGRETRRGNRAGRSARGTRGSRSNVPQTSEPAIQIVASATEPSRAEIPSGAGSSVEPVPPQVATPLPRVAPAITLRAPARPRSDEAQKSTGRPTRARTAPRRAADPEVEVSVEQTESLARAFLAAVEARDRLVPLEQEGFEGRAITAARQDVELVAAALETALRSMDGATRWADELRQPFALLSWFASLAAPDTDTGVAEAGEAVESMLATIEGVLALDLLEGSAAVATRAA